MLISLVGLPGVGKSTIGRRLAARLSLAFADADALLEGRLGESVRTFFEREGEERFRDLEEQLLADLVLRPGAVIATGGGAVLRETNRELLRSTRCVYLRSSPDVLFRRLKHDVHRPLLQVANPLERLRELSDLRDPLYRDVATLTIETSHRSLRATVDTLAAEFIAELSGETVGKGAPQ